MAQADEKSGTTPTPLYPATPGPFDGSIGWIGKLSEFAGHPAKFQQMMWRETMGTLAKSASDYAAFVEKLAKADTPLCAFAIQNEYLGKLLSSGVSDSASMMEKIAKLPQVVKAA